MAVRPATVLIKSETTAEAVGICRGAKSVIEHAADRVAYHTHRVVRTTHFGQRRGLTNQRGRNVQFQSLPAPIRPPPTA